MVECFVCLEPYKVITQLHLRKHEMTLDSYLEAYPEAKIRDDYICKYCEKEVTNGKSSKSKYCATVYCELCRDDIPKSIGNNTSNDGHLMGIHGLSNEQYLEHYKGAKLLSCSEQVNKDNVLYNVRQYNARKKAYVQRAFREANFEYGIEVDDDDTNGETRIDNTHSAWDFLPNSGYKVLGTISEKDLGINPKTGRIRGLEKLKYQMRRDKEMKK
jgi:hypothetical protein